MRIALYLYYINDEHCLRDWDWMETHPLGGTESSALHMARELSSLGHEVILTNRPEALKQRCDVFVSTRRWEIFAKRFRPGRLNYLWSPDDADQPILEGLRDAKTAAVTYAHVDGVMMLSQYQFLRWRQMLHLPPEKAFLTGNGIPASRFTVDPLTLGERPPALYYGSTPYRGLAHLLQSWPAILRAAPQARLHVFSSMQIYGAKEYPEFEQLYAEARSLPGVTYHGALGQAAIRPVAARCRLLAYPCVFPETSCITAMEAMASGCAVVATDCGALPETASGNVLLPMGPDWIARWQDEVIRLLKDDIAYVEIARRNLLRSRARDWRAIASDWVARFLADQGRGQPARAIPPES